jgi:hypothetical protein
VPIDPTNLAILASACQHKASVLFSGDKLPITFETQILAVEASRLVVENRVKPRFIRAVTESKRFSLQVQMVRFAADHITSDGEHIVFPLGEGSVLEETRQAERFSFTAEERVVLEVLNPYDGETRLSKSVMDMSATGLSIRTTLDSRLFQQGTYLPAIRVLIDGEPYMTGAGRVVYARKLIDAAGQLRTQVGIKFDASGDGPPPPPPPRR